MVNILRRFSQPLMVVFTVLIIVSFTAWGPSYNRSGSSAPAAVINGRPVTGETFRQEARLLAIHARLGGPYSKLIDPAAAAEAQREFQQNLREGRYVRPDQKVTSEGVENSLLFESEAAALGITASQQEIQERLAQAFSGQDGKFDAHELDKVVKQLLNPEGLSESQIAGFMASDVRAMKIANLLAATIPPTPAEIKGEFIRQRLITEASYVVLKAGDFRAAQKVTEDEIMKHYEVRKELLKSPEKRKVRIAAFVLPPAPQAKPEDEAKKTKEQKKAEDEEKNLKQQKLAYEAYDFSIALQKGAVKFEQGAKEAGATLAETAEFFSAEDMPKELEGSPLAVAAAFELTKEKPYSTHIVLSKGTYVLALKEVQQPETLPLDKVRKQLEDELLDSKADAAMMEKANDLRTKLADARKNAKSFSEAAETLKLKAEPFPAFSQMQRVPPGTPHAGIVMSAAAKLAPGEISPVIPGVGTVLIVHVDQRPSVDEKDMTAATEQIAQQITEQRQMMAFYAWLADRREAAGLRPRKDL